MTSPVTPPPSSVDSASRLGAETVTLAYDQRQICTDLSVAIPEGKFTAIIGPNACGKSTLLRALARLLKPHKGSVVLDGNDIHSYPAKEVARRLGLLPQTANAPDGITVADLVSRGRFPHQSLLRQWSPADEVAATRAMQATGVSELSHRRVDELSGGQRQRVWVAMVLAQETSLLLLDEPTTFLDIAHQIELLDLFHQLNREHRSTMVAVLHDLNQAARYADHLIAMKEGRIVASGEPRAILTAELVHDVFALPCVVIDDPESHTPLVIPRINPNHRVSFDPPK